MVYLSPANSPLEAAVMDGMDAVNNLINTGGVPELADIVAQTEVSKRQRVEHAINLIFDESPMPSLMEIDVQKADRDRDHRQMSNNNNNNHGQPPPQMGNNNGPWNRGNGPPPPHGQFHGNQGGPGHGPRRPNNNNNGEQRSRGGRWSNRR